MLFNMRQDTLLINAGKVFETEYKPKRLLWDKGENMAPEEFAKCNEEAVNKLMSWIIPTEFKPKDYSLVSPHYNVIIPHSEESKLH